MTRDEAARILGVSPTAKRRTIDNAFADLQRNYAARSQFATKPVERDVAAKALKFLQEAHRELTGVETTMSSRRRRKLDTTSAAIPRKRIIGQSANQSSGTRQVWLDFKVIWPVPWRSSIPLNEKTAAVAICTVMFTIALIVVACI